MIKKLVFIGVLTLCLCAMGQGSSPVYYKVASAGDTVFSSSYHVFSSVINGNPGPAQFMKPANLVVGSELDVMEETVPFTLTVNNLPVLVPAVPKIIPPPPAIPPSITITLTLNPLPVVLNGTKYLCSSVDMDNTGTLTLVCNSVTSEFIVPKEWRMYFSPSY